MISRRIVVNVITFLVLSAGLVAGLVVSVFRVQPKYSVYAMFDNTGGAFTNQEVTYRGVTVGRIGEMALVEDGVRLELVIESRFDEIPQDTHARVMFKSAVGEQFVDLLPRTDEPPFLTSGDVIPKESTSLPVQQEELLRLLDQVLEGVPPEAIRSLVDTLGEGLGGRGEQLHLALGALDPITAVLAGRIDELNDLAVHGDRVGTAFDATRGDFVSGVRSLSTVAETLGRSAGNTERLLEVGASAVPEIAGLIASRKQQINTTIANLAEATRITHAHLDSFRDLLDWLPLLLDTLIQSYDTGLGRFRFGQVMHDMSNRPCTYGTPRRATDDRSGDAPYHPIIDFDCEGADPSPQSASGARRGTTPGAPADGPTPVGAEAWLRVVTEAIEPR